jgi:hypothetical protein
MTEPLRTDTDDSVRVITLTRADEYNTINPALRDALASALDASRGPGVLRRLPTRLGDEWTGRGRRSGRTRVGLGRRPAGDR